MARPKTIKFTKTEQRLLDILADGESHLRQELRDCLPDELGSMTNLRVHLTAIRKKIRPLGEDIVCVLAQYRRICYRHVRMLGHEAYTGKR